MCVCSVALVEQPDPAAASLLLCISWGMWGAMWGEWLGVG